MTDTAKPTSGTWRVDPTDETCVITDALGVGDIVCLSPSEGGFEESAKHWEANAELIIEAGTVYHETGLTPRQLVEQRDGLLAALINLRTFTDRQICRHDSTHRAGAIWEICDDCGAKWADDQGGKPEFQEPASLSDADAIIAKVEAKP